MQCGQVFDRLRTESPDVFNKVKAVEAKFDTHDLDISEENKSILWNEVDVRIPIFLCSMHFCA